MVVPPSNAWTLPPRPRPARRRWVWVLLGVLGAITAVFLAGIGLLVWWYTHVFDPLEHRVDEVRLPARFALVGDERDGNALCLDACPELTRIYAVPAAPGRAFSTVLGVLAGLGYAVPPDPSESCTIAPDLGPGTVLCRVIATHDDGAIFVRVEGRSEGPATVQLVAT